MSPIVAYHVSDEEQLTRVKTNVCDDEDRDGHLYGAKVACFTTTLYKGRLPDFSPYPRTYKAGAFGYRYTTEFHPRHYDKFLMATSDRDGVEQVHFLLLDNRRPRERVVAAFVRAFLQSPDREYDEQRTWSKYFPDGQANDFATGDKVFVNVMFWHSVSVQRARVADSDSHQVKKKGPRFARSSVADGIGWLERVLGQLPNEDEDDINELDRAMRSTRIQ